MVRFKNRYILAEIITESDELNSQDINIQTILNTIRDQVQQNYGIIGYSKLCNSFQIKYFNNKAKLLIFRAPREHFTILWNTLTLMTSIKNHKMRFRVIDSSSTIKKIEKRTRFKLQRWLHSKLKDENIQNYLKEQILEEFQQTKTELENLE